MTADGARFSDLPALADGDGGGCPSGLAPDEGPNAGDTVDPAHFVTKDAQGRRRLELIVRGAKCAGCLRKIETGVMALSGVGEARMNLSSGRLTVLWNDPSFRPIEIVERLNGLGYGAAPFDPDMRAADERKDERELLKCLAVAGFAAANVMLLSVSVWAGHGEMGETTRRAFHWISGAIAIPAAAYAGRPFFRSAFRALKGGHVNMDVPISLGVILACALSVFETLMDGAHAYFDAAVMLLFFLLIGRYLDVKLRAKARAAAGDLLALRASAVTRLDGDAARAVPVRDIRPGDQILIAAGERVSVDVELIDGRSEFDTSLVTGESAPASAAAGARIYSGSINLSRPVVGKALASADDSLLADIARMMEAGEQSRSTYRQLAEKAAELYVPVVHTLSLACLLVWLALGVGFRESAYHAISLLIITCPCALGLAAPVVQIVAVGRLFAKKALVKSGDALQRVAECDTVVFDKTGTLTLGRPALVGELDSDSLALAARLARTSRHPLSRALAEAAGPGPKAADVEETPGSGLSAILDGRAVRLGSAAFVGAEAASADAASEIWLKAGDAAPVRFAFADQLRPQAKATLDALKARGLDVLILSGDRESAVRAASDALGGIPFSARLTPQGKIERLEALKAAGKRPLMIGDGLNDAAALAAAHASASPGSAADISQNAADVVLQAESLSPVVDLVDGSRAAKRRMLENFAFAGLYNVIAVPIAFFGFATPIIAAIAMSASSIVVTLNALRGTPRKPSESGAALTAAASAAE